MTHHDFEDYCFRKKVSIDDAAFFSFLSTCYIQEGITQKKAQFNIF